jgi:hypothetical protein
MGSTASVYQVSADFEKSQIGTHVDMFLEETVQSLSTKISSGKVKMHTSKSVPHFGGIAIRENMAHTKSLLPLKHHNSLRAHAVRQHSRQRNTYISASSILKFVTSKSVSNADSSSTLGGKISPAASASGSSLPGLENKPKAAQSLGKKFNLKLQINDDEDDWIQV